MKSLLISALVSGVLVTASGQVPTSGLESGKVSGRQLSVHLYNLSGVPSGTLDRATREASNVFATVNVYVVWETGAPDAEEAHATDQSGQASFRARTISNISGASNAMPRSFVVVRIGRGMAGHLPSGALGVALPYAKFGVNATIFQDRIESLCQSAGTDFAVTLGHAIAHELGHVVLGSDEHAPAGIMRARWGKAEFEEAARGSLGFTALQGASIREYRSLR